MISLTGRKPSVRMQKAARITADIISGKRETATKGEILSEAGYSPSFSKQPDRVMANENFKALVLQMTEGDEGELAKGVSHLATANHLNEKDVYLPEEWNDKTLDEVRELAKKEIHLIKEDILSVKGAKWRRAKLVQAASSKRWRIVAIYTTPDHRNRANGLDMYMKIAGNYAPVKNDNRNLNINFSLTALRKEHERRRNQGM